MIEPNFFIVGAPKCGTTSMTMYLKEHPNIFFPPIKEPKYFSDDFKTRQITSHKKYLELFSKATDNHLIIGESSTTYLYSSVAIKKIHAFNPNAKILVLIRNPIDMLCSWHSQIILSGHENVRDFEKAWHLQYLRSQGNFIPRTCREPRFLQYKQVAQFGSQLDRLLNIFPSEQVKIILYDDFLKKTKSIYEEVLDFLEVSPYKQEHFQTFNKNKGYRVKWLVNITKSPEKHFVYNIKKRLGIKNFGLFKAINRLNYKEIERQPINMVFRNELVEEFRDDIKVLSQILDRSLEHWL